MGKQENDLEIVIWFYFVCFILRPQQHFSLHWIGFIIICIFGSEMLRTTCMSRLNKNLLPFMYISRSEKS